MSRAPVGFTLVELIVTLVILGVMLSVVSLSVGTLRSPTAADVPRRIAEARDRALSSGRQVTVAFEARDSVTLFPDGSATPAVVRDGATAWSVDPWTGEVRRDTHR